VKLIGCEEFNFKTKLPAAAGLKKMINRKEKIKWHKQKKD